MFQPHYHDDNLGGLDEFHKQGIVSYAYNRTIQVAKENNLPVPQHGFEQSIELKVGSKKVNVGFFGEGHTRDNIVGYFSSEDIMFGGCLIKEVGAGKGNLAEANADEWSETVRKVKEAYPKVKKIIPGHGKSGGIELLDYTIHLFELRQYHTEEKIRFFAGMSHEICTAITLIKTHIEEINRKDFSEADLNYLDIAAEQAGRLSSIVTHLLDFQKSDVGRGQLSLKMMNIVGLIEHRRMMFDSLAKSKTIEMIFSAKPVIYTTAIDGTMMEIVIDNLISNAIKYSFLDSRILLLFTGNEKQWTLEVKDYGIGIGRKAQRKLFSEFYRSNNAVNTNNIGSGIGLLLAKNYITLHGGQIRCISQEQKGASFIITVPFKKTDVTGTQSETKGLYQYNHGNERFSETAPQSGLFPSATMLTPLAEDVTVKKISLLIVEDDENMQRFLFHALDRVYQVTTANDGAIAWQIIRKQMPDMVVSDVLMPNMDGFELCRLIKSTYETSHIPVVLLTALDGKAEQLHGLGLGADLYLTKPFDMALLSQRIRSIIQNRGIMKEKALKLIGKNDNETLFVNELNDKFIKKAVTVVRANIENPAFDKEQFASAMNVSASLLYKKIKSLTDRSPLDFVKDIRLSHALELLQTHQYTVTEVSELCGFSGISYFGKAFKKYFGKSPSEV